MVTKRCALIIERDKDLRTILAIIIEKHGLNVMECENLNEATELMLRHQPDYVTYQGRTAQLQDLLKMCLQVTGKKTKAILTGNHTDQIPDLDSIQRSFTHALSPLN